MKRIVLIVTLVLAGCATAQVSEQTTTITHSCDGATTGFSFGFRISAASDIAVWLLNRSTTPYTTTLLSITTGYSVSVTNNLYPADGGTVTTVETYSSSYKLVITTDIDLDQSTALTYGNWRPVSVQRMADKSRLIDNELDRRLSQTVRNPESFGTTPSTTLPEYGSAGYLYRSAAGAISLSDAVVSSDVAVGTWWETALAGETLAAARDSLGLQFVMPQDYDAAGDGVTNDATAFQSAINAAIAGGFDLVIPAGTYRINATLNVASGTAYVNGFNIIGVGLPTLIWGGSTSDTMMWCQNWAESQMVGIYFDGNDISGTVGVQLDASSGKGTKNDWIKGVTIEDCPGIGIQIGEEGVDPLVDYITFQNCRFKDCGVNVSLESENARQIDFRSCFILEADTYGLDIESGNVFGYDLFFADNTTSDMNIRGLMAGFKIYGGGSESPVIFTTAAAAQAGATSLGPNILSGFHQQDSPAPSTTVFTYNANKPLILIGCKFQHNFVVGSSSAGIVSIWTEFTAGDFTTTIAKVAKFGHIDHGWPNLYVGPFSVVQDTGYPLGMQLRNVDDDYTCSMYRGGAAPDSYYYKRGDIVWMDTPTEDHELGWICTSAGDFELETTKATFRPLGYSGGGGTIHRLGSSGAGMQTADGKTTLYTVPTGRQAIVTSVIIHSPTGSLAGGTDFDLGDGANCSTWKQNNNLAGMTATTDSIVITSDNTKYTIFDAGDEFGIKPTTGATADVSASVIVYGIEIDS